MKRLMTFFAVAALAFGLSFDINHNTFNLGVPVAHAEDTPAGAEAPANDSDTVTCPDVRETKSKSGRLTTTRMSWKACKGSWKAHSQKSKTWKPWGGKVKDDLGEPALPFWALAYLTTAPCNNADECESWWGSLTTTQRVRYNGKYHSELVLRAIKIKLRVATSDEDEPGTPYSVHELWEMDQEALAANFLRQADLIDIGRLNRSVSRLVYRMDSLPASKHASAARRASRATKATARAQAKADKAAARAVKAQARAEKAKAALCAGPKPCRKAKPAAPPTASGGGAL